jgi:cell division protein FtsQ
VALAAGYLYWLRDSSLVAVEHVEVTGVRSDERDRIVAELTRVAERQTTLHVDSAAIEHAASAFPTVESVSVSAHFPHGLKIDVAERPPALLVHAGGDEVPAAGDGTMLTGVAVDDESKKQLPVLSVSHLPSGPTLEGEPLQQALVLGAAPPPLRPLIEEVDYDKDYGVEATLRGGIPIRFGSGSAAAEKWAAAAAVLADPKVDALTYLDVRVPQRPAAGGMT